MRVAVCPAVIRHIILKLAYHKGTAHVIPLAAACPQYVTRTKGGGMPGSRVKIMLDMERTPRCKIEIAQVAGHERQVPGKDTLPGALTVCLP